MGVWLAERRALPAPGPKLGVRRSPSSRTLLVLKWVQLLEEPSPRQAAGFREDGSYGPNSGQKWGPRNTLKL